MRISDWSSDVCSSDLSRRSSPAKAGECMELWAQNPPGLESIVHRGTEHTWLDAKRTRLRRAGIGRRHRRRCVERGDHVSSPESIRSEERSVGTECGSKCRSRWQPYN